MAGSLISVSVPNVQYKVLTCVKRHMEMQGARCGTAIVTHPGGCQFSSWHSLLSVSRHARGAALHTATQRNVASFSIWCTAKRKSVATKRGS